MKTVSRQKAERAIVSQFRNLIGGSAFRSETIYDDYLLTWELNLVRGVEPQLVCSALSMGSGGELTEKHGGAPAKFCAPYSSSALCVNSFGFAGSEPGLLDVFGLSGFTTCGFEEKLPTSLSGTPPNVDFVATSPNVRLAVESKFLEPLSRKAPKFVPSYEAAYKHCGDDALNQAYLAVSSGRERFTYLDVAQLLKHALGVLRAPQPPARNVLAYLFWEPTNSLELEPFETHRREIAKFSVLMAGSQIQFLHLSYPDLWRSWQSDQCPEKLRQHVSCLIERYELKL
jgi:hypothetical protein